MRIISANSKLPPVPSGSLPFVYVNMAMTADGKIATANRKISSFGSKRDHDHLLELRSEADAVMAGARTVDSNPIDMLPGRKKFAEWREKKGLSKYNLRVIVTGSGSLSLSAEIFKHKESPIIVLVSEHADRGKVELLTQAGAVVRSFGEKEIDFKTAFAWLRSEWKVNRLLCEGGGAVNAALFKQNLVDELHLTICPRIFGGRTAPAIADGAGIEQLAEARQMELASFKKVKDEAFLVYRRASA